MDESRGGANNLTPGANYTLATPLALTENEAFF